VFNCLLCSLKVSKAVLSFNPKSLTHNRHPNLQKKNFTDFLARSTFSFLMSTIKACHRIVQTRDQFQDTDFVSFLQEKQQYSKLSTDLVYCKLEYLWSRYSQYFHIPYSIEDRYLGSGKVCRKARSNS
jgi:hypothetical protein